MDKTKSLKIYVMALTLSIGGIILSIYFIVLPELMKAISEISEIQAKKIENRILLSVIGYFIFSAAINLFVYKAEDKIEKEEKEIQSLLKINPKDLTLQDRLKRIEKQRKLYFALIDPLLIIIIGAIVSIILISMLKPFYFSIHSFT